MAGEHGGPGTSSTKPKPKAKATTKPKTSQEILEEKYGAAYAVLTSIPEIKTILLNAIKGKTPLPAKTVITQIKNSDWWRSNNSTFTSRKMQQGSNPGEYAAAVARTQSAVQKLVTANGLKLTDGQIYTLSNTAYLYGFSEEQILASATGAAVTVGKVFSKGKDTGKANQKDLFDDATNFSDTAASNDILQYARDMGVKLSSADETAYRRRLAASGGNDAEAIKNEILAVSKSLYAPFADKLGTADNQTLMYHTAGYRNLLSQYLEKPIDEVDFSDPLLNLGKGLLETDPSTGQVAVKTASDFIDTIKRDARWYNTENAKNEYRQLADDFLSEMGFK